MGDTMNQTEKNDDLIKVLERMHRWRMAFFALVILIAGIVIGASLMIIFGRQQMMRRSHAPEIAVERMMRELIEHLDLTAQQRQAIKPILIEHMERLQQIRMEVRPQIQAQLASLNKEVSALLDEDQKQQWQREFQRLQNQFHRRPRQHRRRRRGGPPPRFEGDRDGPCPRLEGERKLMPEQGPGDYPEGLHE